MAASADSHTIALVVSPGATIFEAAVPCEVFGLDRSDLADPWYRLVLCSADGGWVPLSNGMRVETRGTRALAHADTVLVSTLTRADQPHPPPHLVRALRRAHARGARIASICTGAYVLAAAGLLDGRRATTHWMHADDLAARYPHITVDPEVLYTDDGDVLTSAGTAAGIDLCLHLVRTDHGSAVANAVARRMVVPPQRDGGQAQYVDLPAPQADGAGLGPVLDWALAHLDDHLTVADLAGRAHLTPRTFTRRFRAATGATPLRWLLSQRVRRAQELLECTDEPVEQIALGTGFGTAAGLRQHFTRRTGVSPQAYRHTFRASAGRH
ncbi:MAG: GlxA family transcriptional regulator [Streptosporangiales bacterium]